MKRDWIFSDADGTLLTFNSFISLQRIFLDYSATFTVENFQDYQTVNEPLWVDYQNGAIISLQLQHGWSENWVERLSVGPGRLNEAFINAMAEVCTLLPGTVSLLSAIRGNAEIGTITNGFSALQQVHLERTDLRSYSDLLVISEGVGVAKSNKGTFDHAPEQAGDPDRSCVLMVGDTTESDIPGGASTGLATYWLNAYHYERLKSIAPTWTVSSLHELEQLPCKH